MPLTSMIPRFTAEAVITAGGDVAVERGGRGDPVLLLHGFPQTRAMWARVASRLASQYTVICADLPGYGDSSCPPSTDDHFAYSKRVLAQTM